MAFPDDENGDVLRRMEATGDDLTRSRNVDFTVVFPNETTAERFAAHFRELGYAASIEFTQTAEGHPWDVVVVKHMAPSLEEIGTFEAMLRGVATPLGGRNDGWGCFSEGPMRETQDLA